MKVGTCLANASGRIHERGKMTPSAWKIAPALTGLTLCLAACSADLGGLEPEPGAPPEDLSTFSSTRFPPGTEVQVCKFKSGLPLRRDPSPYGAIIRYMPEGTRGTVMERLYSWHRLDVAGTIGWAYGTALCLVKQSPPHPKPQGTFLRFAAPADGSSVDNGFWLIESNTAAPPPYAPYAGQSRPGSCVIDPEGNIVASTGYRPGVVFVDIDLDRGSYGTGIVGADSGQDLRRGFQDWLRPEYYADEYKSFASSGKSR